MMILTCVWFDVVVAADGSDELRLSLPANQEQPVSEDGKFPKHDEGGSKGSLERGLLRRSLGKIWSVPSTLP